jgi:hypothetical protein
MNNQNFMQLVNRYVQAKASLNRYIGNNNALVRGNDAEYARLDAESRRAHVNMINTYFRANGEEKREMGRILEQLDQQQQFNFSFPHKKSPKKRSPKRSLSVGTKSQVWKGLAKKTSKGLTKKDLMKNKNGNVVMRK